MSVCNDCRGNRFRHEECREMCGYHMYENKAPWCYAGELLTPEARGLEDCPKKHVLAILAEAVEVGPLGWSPFTESNRHTGLLQDWKQVEFWVRRA